jgi:hypothetical protein
MAASVMLPSLPMRKDAIGGITIRFFKQIFLTVKGENSLSMVYFPM